MDNDNDGGSDRRLSISHAASSMINASDMISQETYQANLRRIQEVKEMVTRLEMNNETAHNNFLVDQLEKRAKDGREAEITLARLRNQPGISEPVQFTNNAPTDNSEVILPTTATLVEVPESHSSSYSSPALTTTPPLQTFQQGHPAKYNWSRAPQVQSYNPNIFPYYAPPSTIRQSQHSTAPRSQAPVEGQMGWHTTQNVPSQTRVHVPLAHQSGFQPTQFQYPSQSWSSYPPPVIALPTMDNVATPGHYASSPMWMRTAPAHNVPNTGSSSTTFREAGFPKQSTASRPPVATQPQNLTSLVSTSQVQLPLHDSSTKIPVGQSPLSRSHHLQPAKPQSRTGSTAVSKPTATSELQQSYEPPPQPQLQQQPPQPRQHPQPPPQPRQDSRSPLSHPQPLVQLPPQSQELPSQRSLQPPQTYPQVTPLSTDRVPSSSISQPHSRLARDSPSTNTPSGISRVQPPGPSLVQEQAQRRSAQPRVDQATFILLFQIAVQRGVSQLKAFFRQAKASGISDEWFRAAINSLPRDVWQSVVAQVNRSGTTVDPPLPASSPQQQVPDQNVPVVSVPPLPTAIPIVQTTPVPQQTTNPSISTERKPAPPAPGQTSGSYAVELQYYAEQATKTAQVAGVSTTPLGSTQKTVAIPTCDPSPPVLVNMRTPRDANKSTLARDILRSLGKIVPNSSHEVRGERKDSNYEVDQPPVVNSAQPIFHVAPPEPLKVPPTTNLVCATSPKNSSAKPNVQAESQHVVSINPSPAKSAVIEGPVLIDLTLEDSDGSVDGKRLEPEPAPTFPIQTCAGAATSSQPVSPANTTNHTPLLQNLSLEEPSADGSIGGDNADVHMYSPPPLPLAIEENMEPEPFYPSLDNAELVQPSSEPLPPETGGHALDGQLPLFLPSPPDSPVHVEPPETDLEMMDDESKTRHSHKRRSVDVDEMVIDIDLLTPPRVRKRRKQQVYVLVPPAPLYVKKAKEMKERAMGKDIDSDIGGDDEEFQYSHLEQLLIEESKPQLSERRCRWLNCGAILNCAVNLLAHLRNHAREGELQAPFLCYWTSCRRQFEMEQERDTHLESHAIRPLPCSFAGCDEQFNKPVEVMQHEVQHQKKEHRDPLTYKPTYRPIVPAIPSRLGPPPQRLPSHRVIPRRVVKCRISGDRHATMGPWVLWNIFSPVDLHTRKQNASMRGRPTRQPISYDMDGSDSRHDDYDFLLALSYPARNAQLDDLDSTLITMSAARGLTLWGSGSTGNSEEGEEYMNMDAAVPILVVEEPKVERKSDGGEVVAATARENSELEGKHSDQSVVIGEEDAVERILSNVQEHMYGVD